ncbi:MAG: SseB family protein [Ruminococcus sp.]|nr:SseB family protein [Ruminococcus sp.]
MAQKSEPVSNPKLIEAIEAMRADFTPETQNTTINAALRGTFFVPAIIEKKKEIVANADNEVKFEEKPKARFLLIKKQDGETFFPAFTDDEELSKFKSNEPYQRVKMRFGDIAMLVEQVPSIKGFVINPMSHNLPFTREMLENIKQVLIKRRNEQQAAAPKAEDKPAE